MVIPFIAHIDCKVCGPHVIVTAVRQSYDLQHCAGVGKGMTHQLAEGTLIWQCEPRHI